MVIINHMPFFIVKWGWKSRVFGFWANSLNWLVSFNTNTIWYTLPTMRIMSNNSTFRRCVSLLIIAIFSISTIIIPSNSYAQGVANLPAPGAMVLTSPAFNPPIIKGITIHTEDPFIFDFIIHPGDENLQGKKLKEESTKLIKYFMAALTVPEDEMWVNLSPYEKDRIIPKGFGDTEMGRDLLAQDYMLKQLTASLMYPEKELGNEFWDRVYERAQEKYGTSEVPMNTFNKVWIVPDKAVIYENGNSVFVVESHLKVMLEEDYLALEENVGSTKHGLGDVKKDDLTKINEISSEVIREIIIPEIEKEVNEGKLFANLRQIANSTILATWYKQNVQQSILHKIYVDKNKTDGIDTKDKEINQKIYNQYVEAFKKGVYDFIKEDYDETTQEIIPRKYFSGGIRNEHDLAKTASRDDQASLMESLDETSINRTNFRGVGGGDAGTLSSQELVYKSSLLNKKEREKKIKELVDMLFEKSSDLEFGKDKKDQVVHESITHGNGVIFDLKNYDVAFDKVKYFQIDEGYFLYVESEDMLKKIDDRETVIELVHLLEGNEVEVQYPSWAALADTKEPGYWANWSISQQLRIYKEEIHPQLAKVVSSVVPHILQNNSSVNILDIFSGEGNFVKILNDKLSKKYPRTKVNYDLLELDETNLEQAHRQIGQLDNVKIHSSRDITEMDSLSRFLDRRLDIVTASGGINLYVLSRGEAIRVVENVYNSLSEGGFFIISGFSPVLLYKEDFEKVGFKVINMTIPENIYIEAEPTEMYILQKVSEEDSGSDADTKLEKQGLVRNTEVDHSALSGEVLDDTKRKGGIDLNPNMYSIEKKGEQSNFKFEFDNQNAISPNITGLVPIIINVTPVTNIPMLLGIKQEKEEPTLSRL